MTNATSPPPLLREWNNPQPSLTPPHKPRVVSPSPQAQREGTRNNSIPIAIFVGNVAEHLRSQSGKLSDFFNSPGKTSNGGENSRWNGPQGLIGNPRRNRRTTSDGVSSTVRTTSITNSDGFDLDPFGEPCDSENKDEAEMHVINGSLVEVPSTDEDNIENLFDQIDRQSFPRSTGCLSQPTRNITQVRIRLRKFTRRKGNNTIKGLNESDNPLGQSWNSNSSSSNSRSRKGSKDSRKGKKGRRDRKGSRDVLGKENASHNTKERKNRHLPWKKKNKKIASVSNLMTNTSVSNLMTKPIQMVNAYTAGDDRPDNDEKNISQEPVAPERQSMDDRTDALIQAADVEVIKSNPYDEWGLQNQTKTINRVVTPPPRSISIQDIKKLTKSQDSFQAPLPAPPSIRNREPPPSPSRPDPHENLDMPNHDFPEYDDAYSHERQTSLDCSLDEVIEEAKSVLSNNRCHTLQDDSISTSPSTQPISTSNVDENLQELYPADSLITSPSIEDEITLNYSVKRRVEDIESQIVPSGDETSEEQEQDISQPNPSASPTRMTFTESTPPPQIMFDYLALDQPTLLPPVEKKDQNGTSDEADNRNNRWSKQEVVTKVTNLAAKLNDTTGHYREMLPSIKSFQQESNVNKKEDEDIYNRTLKVVFLGSEKGDLCNKLVQEGGGAWELNARSSRQRKQQKLKSKKFNRGIDLNVQMWKPRASKQSIKFNLWDLQGSRQEPSSHYATQSLCISPNSLYIIVWNISARTNDDSESDSDDGYSSDDYFEYENKCEMKKKSMIHEIDEHVTYWIDLISKYAPIGCAILPVISCENSQRISVKDIQRRSDILKERLLDFDNIRSSPKILFNNENEVPVVYSQKGNCTSQLRAALLDVTSSTSPTRRIFETLDSKLAPVTLTVQNIVRKLKHDGFEIISIEDLWSHLLEDLPQVECLNQQSVSESLRFLSSRGDVIFFEMEGSQCSDPSALLNFIILKPTWMTSVISCIVGKEWTMLCDRLKDIRCKAAGSAYLRGDLREQSSCPVVSANDTIKIWKQTKFISKACGKISQFDSDRLYSYLQQVCEHCGIFIPLLGGDKVLNSEYYLLPALCKEAPANLWSYKCKDNWKSTLCQSWILKDSIPSDFFDQVIITTLEQIRDAIDQDDYAPYHQDQNNKIGVRVGELKCYKKGIYTKLIDCIDIGGGKWKNNIVELFVGLVHRDSPQCPASTTISSGTRLIVSAKGNNGADGTVIWDNGYADILDSIEKLVAKFFGRDLEREALCPDCLANSDPRNAYVWKMNDYLTYDWSDHCLCDKGHSVSPRLLYGGGGIDDSDAMTTMSASTCNSFATTTTNGTTYRNDIEGSLPGVVLVALWDSETNQITRIGSGFIADSSKGLIITAAHTFYNLTVGQEVPKPREGKVLVGIMPKNSDQSGDTRTAQFVYSADLLSQDVWNVDACVLRITSTFSNPMPCNGSSLEVPSGGLLEIAFKSKDLKKQELQSLKMTRQGRLNEQVVIIGFDQSEEELFRSGQHINQTCSTQQGHLCKIPPRKITSKKNKSRIYLPKSEIVVDATAFPGHSGGPCINHDSKVIGIVSRVNGLDNRCYLAPTNELRRLLSKVK